MSPLSSRNCTPYWSSGPATRPVTRKPQSHTNSIAPAAVVAARLHPADVVAHDEEDVWLLAAVPLGRSLSPISTRGASRRFAPSRRKADTRCSSLLTLLSRPMSKQLLATAEQTCGGVDVLVSNASAPFRLEV